MIANIFLTSVIVFLLALLIIKLSPEADDLPYPLVVTVLGALVSSAGAAFVSVMFLIWAN